MSDTSTDQVDVQVALDTEDLALAVRIAESVGDIARIEAGTPASPDVQPSWIGGSRRLEDHGLWR